MIYGNAHSRTPGMGCPMGCVSARNGAVDPVGAWSFGTSGFNFGSSSAAQLGGLLANTALTLGVGLGTTFLTRELFGSSGQQATTRPAQIPSSATTVQSLPVSQGGVPGSPPVSTGTVVAIGAGVALLALLLTKK